jgi:hypothetical protein
MNCEAPIIIVGAGRSGTKLLRGILGLHPKLISFPYEINYIWRHSNVRWPTDELLPEHARPQVVQYIRRRFKRFASIGNDRRVVEKTCANSLRVEFVKSVFPGSFFIHLIRDGRAVAESARRRWQARPELGYMSKKLRWVPRTDLPWYVARYVRCQLGRLASGDKACSSWGPRFNGLDELVKSTSLIEVCGLQWKACVQAAESSMKRLPSEVTLTLRYEDIVEAPLFVMEKVFDKLKLWFAPVCRDYVERNVHKNKVNKWRDGLSHHDLDLLVPHIKSELVKHGYVL